MFQEAADASNAVRAQCLHGAAGMAAIGAALRRLQPRAVITCRARQLRSCGDLRQVFDRKHMRKC